MKPGARTLALLLALLPACSGHTAPAPPEESAAPPAIVGAEPSPSVPLSAPAPLGDSIYGLHLELLDQDGARVPLDVYRGHPVLIAMFYGTCPVACPMLTSDLKAIEARLSPAERDDLRVLLVSFDPARDTPTALRTLRDERHVDRARWKLAAATDDGARELSAVLGVEYRRMADGEYNHSAKITLLDRSGAPVAEIAGLQQPADAMLGALRAVVAKR